MTLEQKALKKYERIKNLAQNKGKTKEELLAQIIRELEDKQAEKLEDLSISKDDLEKLSLDVMFTLENEKKQARLLAKRYLTEYVLESISDKNTLVQLIFLEIIHNRLQNAINTTYDKSQIVPMQMLDSLHKNLEQISILKDKLGISRDKLDSQKKDSIEIIETLKKKFKAYREQNQASRTLCCPHCGQMTLLKIRIDKYEAIRHPYFRDRILGNVHLIKLYRAGKITKKDVSDILGTSEDYTEWLVEKWIGVREARTEEIESGVEVNVD